MTQQNTTFSARRPVIIGTLTLLLLVVGFGGWGVLSQISGAVVASGQIEVDQNRQIVQHPDGGVVANILVKEGDVVEKGQVLLQLDPTLERSELAIIEDQLYELLARRGRLEAERDGNLDIAFEPDLIAVAQKDASINELVDGQRRLFGARSASIANQVKQLEKRKLQIRNQIVGLSAQQDAIDTQLELVKKELEDQQQLLKKGLAQATRVLSLERAQARFQGEAGDLAARAAEYEGRITEIDIEINTLQTTRREEAISQLRDQQYRALELEERVRALREKLARMEITAPVSGIVYGLTVFTPRSVLRSADPVLYIIPQDRPLIIAAQVEPIHIDEVFVGQDVVLRFSALDQRTTPELNGKVVQISADTFEDQSTQMPFYKAKITLSEGEQSKISEGVTLIPGMPVETFVKTRERSPLAYLVKPLSDYFVKALRES